MVSSVSASPSFTLCSFIDTLRVTRLGPCGAEGPRLGFIAPIMLGRVIRSAFESDRRLGAEESSTEAPVDIFPAPSKSLDGTPFASPEPPTMGTALTEPFPSSEAGGGISSVELLEVRRGRARRDRDAVTEPEATEPGRDVEAVDEGRLGT